MMQCKTRFYNWTDIEQLIYKDCGLNTEQQQRELGELLQFTNMQIKYPKDNCVELRVYDKPYTDRLEDHVK